MDSEHLLPPTPRALSDAELQEVLDRARAEGGGVLAAMQILEAQTQLRETDKSELRAWQAKQDEIGSEEEVATSLDEALRETVEVPLESAAHVEEFSPEPATEPPLADMEVLEQEPELIAVPQEVIGVSVQETASAAFVAVPPVEDSPVEVVVQTKRLARDPSSSQFWVWLPISGSLLPLGFSLWLRSLGLTFEQSLTAALLGIFASAGVVAVGAIAGKRSSLPTLVLSRAAFGVFGNLAPALVLVLSRLFWALVLVTVGYLLIGQNLAASSSLAGNSGPLSWLAVSALALLVLGAAVLSSVGGRVLIWSQRLSGGLGIATVLAITIAKISGDGFASETAQSGSWLRALGASVVIFAIFGLAWSSASSDYASGLPVKVRGWKVAGWAILSMGVVPALIATIALFAFGDLTDKDFASSFGGLVAGASLSTVSVLVQVSLVLSLVTTIAMSLRSSSMSFESIALKVKPSIASPIIAVGAFGLAVAGFSYLGASGFWFNLHGYAVFLAVPVAAWSGIFVADVLIRRIAYHEVSLSRSYGFYKAVNLTNTLGWLAAVALGWGLLKSDLVEFGWLGYLADLTSNAEFWAQSNFGVVIAFAIGLLLPVSAGIPRIKRQEQEVLAIEARRNDLKNVLGMVD
jgi:purine-cytosine permease-like protein